MKAPDLKTPDQYRQFMNSETGSTIEPGSEEEGFILDSFKKARRTQAEQETGTRDNPGPIAEQLQAAEEKTTGTVRPEDSRIAHQEAHIKISGPRQQAEQIEVSRGPTPAGAGASPKAQR